MRMAFRTFGVRRGLSLAEVLAALLIGSMVLIALLGLYSRAERATAAVNRKLDSSRLPGEILQRIAEDIDKLISPGSETTVTIENKLRKGYPAAKLTIVRTITDSKNEERILEEMRTCSGSHFDPSVIEAFFGCLDVIKSIANRYPDHE